MSFCDVKAKYMCYKSEITSTVPKVRLSGNPFICLVIFAISFDRKVMFLYEYCRREWEHFADKPVGYYKNPRISKGVY